MEDQHAGKPVLNSPKTNNLTAEDYRRLEEESGISPDLVDIAGIRRVDSYEGALIVGREKECFRGKYSGLYFEYRSPYTTGDRGGRLRRDCPEYEVDSNGDLRERNKYLGAPGQSNKLYHTPGQTYEQLQDSTLPLIIAEGEK